MDPSLGKKCEELRRANSQIEEENRKLCDLISSQQQDAAKVEEGLSHLAEIKLQDEREVESPGYGENPLTLQVMYNTV